MATNKTITLDALPDVLFKKLAELKAAAGDAISSTMPSREDAVRAARYSAAAFEYIGLASAEFMKVREPDVWRFIKAAGQQLDEYQTIASTSISQALRRIYKQEFDELKRLAGEVAALQAGNHEAVSGEDVEKMVSRLNRIEERLAYIERHGISIAKESAEALGLRKTSKEKLGLLRQLVEINKELRSA